MKTIAKLGLTAVVISTLLFSCKKADATSSADASVESSSKEDRAAAESSGDSYSETETQQQIQAGQITAGEWNDLSNWVFWESLNNNSEFSEMSDHWKYQLKDRVSVNVKSDSENLVDVPVSLINSQNEIVWSSRTNNKGNAELWPYLKGENQSNRQNLKIKIGNQIFKNIESFDDKKINRLVLQNYKTKNTEKKIDIAFMVDATGSMGDELEYLKEELTDVISKVKNKNQGVTVNMGAVFYRDKGEDYVTKISDFSTDIDDTVDFIKDQSAEAGGDFPEAVETALDKSINDLEWSEDATSRILFLVLDAPPHYEDDIISEIHDLIATASKKGIRIIPITASGIDKETEFLMRYMAIATNGTYVFITNDSGIGNDHIAASVGNYQVEHLNKLMVRLINESIK
ncbi:VWA domain-containing protein [Flavobacterium psychroterrae]|uniref:VWA domain-containing protein n=1 Tax=Flavobacterium psychroterrae TaxID=2133767 RepID=A0ABS5PAM4_9FLAO|nr:vWA domain-containing protein [Flavobacterium psychroterrae]MBS7230918.1 VWA domain-containing protein [Flavobacterium psychroterrae]